MLKQVIVFAVLALLVAIGAHADDFDTKLAHQCPATETWVKAHPSRENSDKKRTAYDAAHHFGESALRKELAVHFALDEKARADWIASDYSKASADAMLARDASNLAWLKPLMSKHGFPTVDQVGEEGVFHAFILVQHATSDPAFQARVLREIAPRLKSGGISEDDYALLKDRVLLEQGKKQIYGTQFIRTSKNGKWKLRPLEDPKHVNQRRAAMGLMPLADYKCMLKVVYAPPARQKS